jgi:muramidase (phage lysozyme)
MSGAASSIGSFLTGFANGYSSQKQRKQIEDYLAAARAARSQQQGANAPTPSGPAGAPADPAKYGDAGYAVVTMDMPATTQLAPYQAALLNAIAAGESGGKYNVRYTPDGGTTFDLNAGHPRVYEPTEDGRKSSAAGRYQFTWTTWKDVAGADTPFTPENQDKYAWALAVKDYYRNTGGRDLAADLQANGFTPEIATALKTTWASLNNPNKAMSAYADTLSRLTAQPTMTANSGIAPQTRSVILSFGMPNPASTQEASAYPLAFAS